MNSKSLVFGRICSALLLLTVPYMAACQSRVAFGFAVDGSGHALLGFHDGSRFLPVQPWSEATRDAYNAQVDSVLAAFRPGGTYDGYDELGRRVQVRVDSIDPRAEQYESVFDLRFPGSKETPHVVLFTSAPLNIKVLKATTALLSPALDSVLRARGQEMWVKALKELAPEDTDARYALDAPTVERVEGVPGFLVVYFPLQITWNHKRPDDRASMFFIVDSLNQIALSRFGHPEWAPSEESTVLTIRPSIFFRVEGSPDIFFLGTHEGGWEDLRWAIYELRTGAVVLTSY